MPDYRISTFFSQSNMGWSETWWKSASSLSELAPIVSRFLDHRNDLLTTYHNVIGCRIAIEGDARKSRLFTPGSSEVGPGINVIVPAVGDYPIASPLVEWDQVRAVMQYDTVRLGVTLGKRYLSGMPDLTSKTEPATINGTTPANWWDKWRQYINFIKTNGFAVKILDKTAGNPERKIVKWVTRALAPNIAGAVTAIAESVNVVVGDKVLIRGTKMKSQGTKPINGTWVVDQVEEDALAGTKTIFLRGTELFDVEKIKTLGKIRKQAYEYAVPDIIDWVRGGIHKRGKPSNSPRGRTTRKTYSD